MLLRLVWLLCLLPIRLLCLLPIRLLRLHGCHPLREPSIAGLLFGGRGLGWLCKPAPIRLLLLLVVLHAWAWQRCWLPVTLLPTLLPCGTHILVVRHAGFLLPPPHIHLPLLVGVAGGEVACHAPVFSEPVCQRACH